MVANSPSKKAVDLLQELGLREYEAEAFIALTQIPNGTAREVSTISEIPRTRVYDAVESLEERGLVEIQHTSPKKFRAVSIEEAINTLRAEYESTTASLQATLEDIGPAETVSNNDVPQKVWSLAGKSAIASRLIQLIEDCENELIFFVGDEAELADSIVDELTDAIARGINVYVGALTESLNERIQTRIPGATVFTSQLDWMTPSMRSDDQTTITKLLLVDRENILVSTFDESAAQRDQYEMAVLGQGSVNGFVTVVRRLISNEVAAVPSNVSDTS